MHGMLAKRSRNIRPAEICRQAKISRSTFYAHYDDKNFVEQYEIRLKDDFCARLPKLKAQKEVIFRILLRFVQEKSGYFEATTPNANFWLLKSIFEELHLALKAKDCSQKSYDFYVMQQITLISCWVRYDKCAPEKMKAYVRKMTNLPMMRIDI